MFSSIAANNLICLCLNTLILRPQTTIDTLFAYNAQEVLLFWHGANFEMMLQPNTSDSQPRRVASSPSSHKKEKTNNEYKENE